MHFGIRQKQDCVCVCVSNFVPLSVKMCEFVLEEGGGKRHSSSTSTSPGVVVSATPRSVAEF